MDHMDRRSFLMRGGLGALALSLPGVLETVSGAPGPLTALARATDGPLLRPGSAGYRVAQPGFNLAYAGRRPLAILQPVNAGDVAEALRWAAERNVRIAARSGGHSYAGYSSPDRGLLVDLRRMRGVRVLGNGHVRVGAGAQLIDVHRVLSARGLTLPTGTCPSVGVSGLTLGGGYGLSSRMFGLLCDRLVAAEIVTPDGRRRRVDARHDPDLFWALRGGGGGNFGIVTAFEFAPAHARRAAWFLMRWPWEQAEEVLDVFLRLAPTTDRRLTALCTLSTAGSVTVLGQYYGTEARMRSIIGPLRRISGASFSSGTSSTMELVQRWAGCLDRTVTECHTAGTRTGGQLPRERFAAASGYLRRVPNGAGIRRLTALIERRRAQGQGGALIVDAYGGAIADVAPTATAFVHRRELASVQAYTSFAAGREALARRWLADVRGVLADVGSGFAYQNYIDPRQPNWAHAYYGANLGRLADLRRIHDPDGVLRFAQAIPLRAPV
ncbi:MAG: FAD-binding oxidoreductase [Actinobacteria bacterium]|nr:FAD-binding oxidoreductase [Actinomycetota bacterium]